MNRTIKSVLAGSVLGVIIVGGMMGAGPLLSMLDHGGSKATVMKAILAGPYLEVILGGAVAGLIASRLRLRWLPGPSVQQPTLSMVLAAVIRVALSGAIYGGIGGAITGAVFIVFMFLNPCATAPVTELPRAVAIYGLIYALLGALTVGGSGALWGAINSRGIARMLQSKSVSTE